MPTSAPLLHSAMLRWLDELSNQGIFTTDTELIVRSWNSWLERHTGIDAADAVGRTLFELLPDLVVRGFDQHYRAALDGEISVLAQTLHRHLIELPGRGEAAATMPQSSRIAPLLQSGSIVGTITVIDDVTERVTSEREMRRQIAAAEAARATAEDALRMKDEFLATLSHEIRTPLNAVMGWTKLLLARPVDAATLERGLRVIDRNATAQARLIEDMLDMARIVSGKLRLELGPADLVAVTAAAVDVIAPAAAAKGVTIRTRLGRVPQPIVADADRLAQIAWNILSNAVKFTPAGGTIDVAVVARAGAIALRVRDTGEGISAEFLPFVFERFRQANSSTSRSQGGLGLGLALVRELVELHGGCITVESPGPGQGATFTAFFPEPADEVDTEPRPSPGLVGQPLQSVRLLVVDDDADWRDLLTVELSAYGAAVTTAGSAQEAIALMTAAGFDCPSVIIADIAMPGDEGFVFLERVRALDPPLSAIPAIAIGAFAGPATERRASAAGFSLHLAKPLAPHVVASAVLEVLRARSPR